MDKVLVSKEKLKEVAEFFEMECYHCGRCPAYDICLTKSGDSCKDSIINYLLGGGSPVTIDVNHETTECKKCL